MADPADLAQPDMEREDAWREANIVNRPKYVIPPGVQGDCDLCGNWSGRLIGGVCATCRDRYHLS